MVYPGPEPVLKAANSKLSVAILGASERVCFLGFGEKNGGWGFSKRSPDIIGFFLDSLEMQTKKGGPTC